MARVQVDMVAGEASKRLALGATLAVALAACAVAPPKPPVRPAGSGGAKPAATVSTARPTSGPAPAIARAGAVGGLVVGPDGAPAAGVAVRAYLISDHGAGIISDSGASLIANNGGSVIANNGAGYRLQQVAGQATSGPDGRFTLAIADGARVNVEAVQSDALKAFVRDAGAGGDVRLRLRKTGAIAGRIVAPEGSGVTNLLGLDVFVPGSSYTAKAAADGAFRLDHVPEGEFTLVTRHPTLGEAVTNNVVVAPEQVAKVGDMVLRRDLPAIARTEPAATMPGQPLVIHGANFGMARGATLKVTVDGLLATDARREAEGRISLVVPPDAKSGEIVVAVDGVPSAPARVLLLQRIEAQRWASGPITVGEATCVSWRAIDATGAERPDVAPVWAAEGDAIAVAGGRVVGRAPGKARATLAVGAVRAEVEVEVVAGAAVRTFIGYPEPAFVPGGDTGLEQAYRRLEHHLIPTDPFPPAAAFPGATGLDLSEGAAYVGQIVPAPVRRIDLATGAVEVVPLTDAAVSLDVTLDFVHHRPGRGLYISERTKGNQVVLLPPGGDPRYFVRDEAGFADGPGGLQGQAQVARPLDLVTGPDGTLYVADDMNHAVRAISPDGVMRTIAGAPDRPGHQDGPAAVARFNRPVGLAIDGRGGLLVSEVGNRVRRIDLADPAAPVSTVAGTGEAGHVDGPAASARFNVPIGLALGADGTIFVAERENHRLRAIGPDGAVTTIAGEGARGLADGGGPTARFAEPCDLACEPGARTLLVADRANGRVRIVRY